MNVDRHKLLPPPLVAAAGWAFPGLGYFLIGEKIRGLTIGITILCLFLGGLLIGGVRVLEVPMYNDDGLPVENADFVREIRGKPWSIAQVLTGPVGIAGGAWSVSASRGAGAKSHVRLNEIGTLYTAVAGMLNLLAMIDCAQRASRGAA